MIVKQHKPDRTLIHEPAKSISQNSSLESSNITTVHLSWQQQTKVQRLHSKDEYSGSGIGLTLCKKIAEDHLGRITAVSEPGTGSEFSVFLPFK